MTANALCMKPDGSGWVFAVTFLEGFCPIEEGIPVKSGQYLAAYAKDGAIEATSVYKADLRWKGNVTRTSILATEGFEGIVWNPIGAKLPKVTHWR